MFAGGGACCNIYHTCILRRMFVYVCHFVYRYDHDVHVCVGNLALRVIVW